MGAAETPYEKLRRRKLEENRRKIEELKLAHISLSLRGEAAAHKPSPVSPPDLPLPCAPVLMWGGSSVAPQAKPRKKAAPLGGLLVAVRRSERKRDPVNYKEVVSLPLAIPDLAFSFSLFVLRLFFFFALSASLQFRR